MTDTETMVQERTTPIAAIAMIDDGLRPMRFEHVPENERDAVLAVLSEADVLEELASRGVDASAVADRPDDAIEALTRPDRDNGVAYYKISDVSETTVRMIGRRQMMRQIAGAIRSAGECEVAEFGPEDDLADIARFDVVFIDYFLDDREADGTQAERIAGDVQSRRSAERRQQIVLMSTSEGVRAMRTEFRKNAKIEAASFAFVAKKDLDEDWKVKAHLEMLARGMQHSSALGGYIAAVKRSAKAAAEALSEKIDDLDIGDFAYIQRIALHADGHPLGDYLGWLLSSHLTALAFEGELRTAQAEIDGMEFEDGPLSPAEPSVEVAALYHDALFARNLGPLGRHPRVGADSKIADVPFVQLGDVFLKADRTSAVVILSPDCDLAFSTDPQRPPDRDLGVILLFGDPNTVASDPDKDASTTTEGMVDGSEVYRIEWRFSSFRTVRLEDLSTMLVEAGFDTSRRDRLRPIYSLKLQHELGNHLMRVGPPVMPPIAKHARSKIRYGIGEKLENIDLVANEVVVSRFKKSVMVRFTPSLVGKLKLACADVLEDLTARLADMPTEGKEAQAALKAVTAKAEGLRGQMQGANVWSGLLADQVLPASGECKKIKSIVHIANGTGWLFPPHPAVVLVVGEEQEAAPVSDAGSADLGRDGDAASVRDAEPPVARQPSRRPAPLVGEAGEAPSEGNVGFARAGLPKSKSMGRRDD